MPAFIGNHGGDDKTIDVEPLGEGRYAVSIDGERHEVDARHFDGGNWSLIVDGQS